MNQVQTTINGTIAAAGGTSLSGQVSQRDYIILDGSGSMQSQWWDTLSALDQYVAGVKSANIDTRITLSIFTSPAENIDMVARDCHISQWQSVSDPATAPGSYWGSTPLFDAIEVGLLKVRNENPERATIVIATDGGENGSQICSEERARAILDWARSKGYQVIFIGCEFNNSGLASRLGATPDAAIGVQTRLLGEAMSELARKRAAYGLGGAPMTWSEEERKNFGGYLSGR